MLTNDILSFEQPGPDHFIVFHTGFTQPPLCPKQSGSRTVSSLNYVPETSIVIAYHLHMCDFVENQSFLIHVYCLLFHTACLFFAA